MRRLGVQPFIHNFHLSLIGITQPLCVAILSPLEGPGESMLPLLSDRAPWIERPCRPSAIQTVI